MVSQQSIRILFRSGLLRWAITSYSNGVKNCKRKEIKKNKYQPTHKFLRSTLRKPPDDLSPKVKTHLAVYVERSDICRNTDFQVSTKIQKKEKKCTKELALEISGRFCPWVLPADCWADSASATSHRAKATADRNPVLRDIVAINVRVRPSSM